MSEDKRLEIVSQAIGIRSIKDVFQAFSEYSPATIIASSVQTLMFHLEDRLYEGYIVCGQETLEELDQEHFILIEDIATLTPALFSFLDRSRNKIISLKYVIDVYIGGPAINSLEHVYVKGRSSLPVIASRLMKDGWSCALVC
jgi:hypothetical protein